MNSNEQKWSRKVIALALSYEHFTTEWKNENKEEPTEPF